MALFGAACVPAPETGSRAPTAPKPGPATLEQSSTYIPAGERSGIGGCPIYPRDNVFRADVSKLPVRSDSAATIAAAGPDLGLGPGVYSFVWQGSRGGIPVNVVDSRRLTPTDVVGGTYWYMSDLQDHPIPADPKIEGHPGIAWDRHMILLDLATCVSSEFFYVTPPNPLFDRWVAETAVKIDLTSNKPRALGSATAAGISMLATMMRYDEVASGNVDHMLEVALPTIRKGSPRWPATRTDGNSEDPTAPPMGTVLRLRSDADLSGFGPQARTVARALQKHGAVVGDTGPGFGLRGENDHRWDDSDLQALTRLELSDFEVVDVEPMKVSDDSYRIR